MAETLLSGTAMERFYHAYAFFVNAKNRAVSGRATRAAFTR
jgi:hypothetical protein